MMAIDRQEIEAHLAAVAPILPQVVMTPQGRTRMQQIIIRRFPGLVITPGRTTAEAIGDLVEHLLQTQQAEAQAKGR